MYLFEKKSQLSLDNEADISKWGTFQNKTPCECSVSHVSAWCRDAPIISSSGAMEKEKKEKPKKKKITKKEAEGDEREKKFERNVLENIQQTSLEESDKGSRGSTKIFISEDKEPVAELLTESWKRNQNVQDQSGRGREKGRNTPEGFYIAHPRSIKRTAHFKDVHSRKLSELLEAFHMFDFDRDGVINHEDLKKTFASLCIDVEEEEIDQMLLEGLNPLNFDAFVILLGYKTLDLDPEEVLLDALSNWDDHQEGLISYERISQHIMAWGDKFTEEEAIAAFADAPIVLNKTKEKMIDYIQFSEDLCGLRKMMQRKTIEGEI